MKLDKQILELKNKFNHLNEQLMNSENLDNKKIIMINKDLSKLEPIITLSNMIEKIENEIIGYKDILENENDEELRDIAKIELPIFEKDKIYEDTQNFFSKNNLGNIENKDFINLLVPLKRANYSQTFILHTNNLGPIYYKIKYINKKTIIFGELLQLNKIELDLNNDFLIDLSNIANIDKIIYRGIEIKLKNNYQFYLKDFNINELETLL